MVSFDVFDTLITRATVSPTGIFAIMRDRLLCQKVSLERDGAWLSDFVAYRKLAEAEARNGIKYIGKEEISLTDIYSRLSEIISLTSSDASKLMDLEREAELDCVLPIQPQIAHLKELLRQGEQIVLISDMYLSQQDIRNMLVRADKVFEDMPLYVSSDCGETKSSGLLYQYVKEKENVEFDEWTHYGDHEVADVLCPQLFGIHAVHVKKKDRLPWETHYLSNRRWEADTSLQLCMGAAGYLRESGTLSADQEIGASFGGMLLFPYVDWLLEECGKRQIRRLYFIARDGFVLKKIADQIISCKGLSIFTYYIYGSRCAWRLEDGDAQIPMVQEYFRQEIDDSDHAFAFVDLSGTGQSIDRIAEMMQWKEKPRVFFLTLYKKAETPNCDILPYMLHKNGAYTEVFARAPHGCTVGYKRGEGRIVPILSDVLEGDWEKTGLQEYLEGVELFSAQMAKIFVQTGVGIDWQCFSWDLFQYLDDPHPQILDFAGELFHTSTEEDAQTAYAPRLSRKELREIYIRRRGNELTEVYRGEHIEYSLKRLGTKDTEYVSRLKKMSNLINEQKRRLDLKTGRGKRVIIYAAGQVGVEVYERLLWRTPHVIVGWTDINYPKYQKLGYPVRPLQELLQSDYDYIVIAVRAKKVARQIKALLKGAGVNETKVRMLGGE